MEKKFQLVQQQFNQWRRQKKYQREPIPESLWQAALQLIPSYPITQVARTLRLNFMALKRRLKHSQSSSSPLAEPINFIEVSLPSMEFSSDSVPPCCDRVEVQKSDGSRLSLYAREGQSFDELVLLKRFLGE